MKARIHLEESLSIKANAKGEIVNTDSSGVLNVINPSEKTTLWGIKLTGDHAEDVDTFQDEEIQYIEAGKEFNREYKTGVSPLIQVSEVIDTNFDGNEINALDSDLVFGIDQPLAFQIIIKNNYAFDIRNITVEKHFPADSKNIRAIDPYIGEVNIPEDANIVNWLVPKIKAGESKSIIVSCNINPTNVQPYNTGIVVLKCETDNKFSTLVPVIDGDADSVDLGLEAKESTVPYQWLIDFGLRNASEFEILLKYVKISVNNEEKYMQELNKGLEANVDEPIWKQQILVESSGYPEVTKHFDYFVQFEITEHSTIAYEKDNDQMNVVKVSVNKVFEPREVVTYAITNLAGIIDITNTGTATIGKIKIEDTIPGYIEIDEVLAEGVQSNIEVDFIERPKTETTPVVIIEERERATFEDLEEGTLDTKPAEPEVIQEIPEDITVERKYHYVLSNLEMTPGQTLKIKTIGYANKPRFDGLKPTPSQICAYAKQPTKPYVTEALFENKEPSLMIEFKKRSYKITSIFKKIDEDDYEVEIPVENTGDVALDNVLITQPIFNAEYRSHTPPTVDVNIHESNVKCHIKRINPGETVTISLQVRSVAPLRQQQATIKIED